MNSKGFFLFAKSEFGSQVHEYDARMVRIRKISSHVPFERILLERVVECTQCHIDLLARMAAMCVGKSEKCVRGGDSIVNLQLHESALIDAPVTAITVDTRCNKKLEHVITTAEHVPGWQRNRYAGNFNGATG